MADENVVTPVPQNLITPEEVPQTWGSHIVSGIKENVVNPIINKYQEMQAINAQAQVTPEQMAALEQMAAQNGVPISDLIDAQTRKNLQSLQAPQQPMPASTASPEATVAQDTQYSAEDFPARPAPVTTTPQMPTAGTGEMNAANALGQSYRREQNANKAVAEAGALKAQEDAAYREQLNKQLLAKEAEIQEIGRRLEERSNEELSKLQELQKKTQEFKFQDFWANKTEGQKIGAAIAIALGGIGAAMQGRSENKALEIINSAIDRDLKIQQMNFEKLQKEGEHSKSILSMLNQQFDNRMQVETAARTIMLQQAQNELQRIAGKWDAPELRARAQVLNEGLERQKIMYVEAFKKAAKEQALQQQLLQGTQSGDFKNLTPAQVQQIDMVYKGFADRYVPGYGEAVNPEAAKDFRKYRDEVEPAIHGARRVLEIAKNFNRVTDLETRAALKTELAALAGQLRLPFTGPGAMTDKEYERLAATIGDPTKLATMPGWERAKLSTVLKKLQLDLDSRAKNAGLPVVSDNYEKLKFTPMK